MRRPLTSLGTAVLSAAALLSHGCDCSLRGCGTTAELRATLPVEFEQLRTARLETCWNDQCRTALLSQVTEPPLAKVPRHLKLEAPPGSSLIPLVTATLLLEDDGSLSLAVDWRFGEGQERNGDTYRVNVNTDAGVPVLAMTETAVGYTVTRPDADACGDERCPRVRFDRRRGN